MRDIQNQFTYVCADYSTPASNCTDGTLRLVGGAHPAEGRIEICINNAWGTVCDEQFTTEEALVACRQLGLLQTEGIQYVCKTSIRSSNFTVSSIFEDML